jgi:hypothetical protein
MASKRRMNVLINLSVVGTVFFNSEKDFSIRIKGRWQDLDLTQPELRKFFASHSFQTEHSKKGEPPSMTYDMKDTSYKPNNLQHLIDLLRMDGVGIKEV